MRKPLQKVKLLENRTSDENTTANYFFIFFIFKNENQELISGGKQSNQVNFLLLRANR